MNTEQQQLKSLLLRDKEFLKSLYESQSPSRAKNIINSASDQKLNTLLKFLHFLVNGKIKLKKEHFDALKIHHVKAVKKALESSKTFKRLLKDERETKLKLLLKLASSYNFLLYTLFNQIITSK